MHLHFERNTNAKCDCAILSLTWMGKVPDELPEDEGWKLNRTNYYQEGWLATGNVRGIVGVTFTTSHCKKAVEFPLRTNYNLRGHRSEVILVKWNEPYQKLASCDSSGIIFVWIKYEGRWSIELINDRNTPVTHFSWSHDGRMALICYQDGFVLVGSVAGQRYWSSMLNLESTITCGIWTPDDQQVYFGTTGGQIIVMDVHGAMVSQVQLSSEVGITGMAWSCEKFKMEEGDDVELPQPDDRTFVLAVSLSNGYIFLMKSFDDVSPVQIHTGLCGPLRLEWSNSRELLVVAGSLQHSSPSTLEYTNMLKFYSDTGILLYSAVIPHTQSPVTALTWGHNDKRLFVATGCQVHIAWVSRRVASLQLMCRLQIHRTLRCESQLSILPLPPRIKALISNLFAQTIRCCVPEVSALRDFVSRPPVGSVRLHCTMIRHDEDSNLSSGTCYTLYLEYLGGLVPLLKGKRTSKIRPEFVIFDPQLDELSLTAESTDSAKSSGSSQNNASDTSDTEHEDGCGSPRVQRRRRRRNKSHSTQTTAGETEQDDLAYVDTLPEHIRLVEVTSNIWGTKFKIHGLATSVPANLGQVTYKTSLLHLQPRQMTLVMTELRDDFPLGPDPNFNPNLFSEDEEEIFQGDDRCRPPADIAPPIAPMTPRAHHTTAGTAGRFAPQNRHPNIRPIPKTSCQHPEVHEGSPSLNANLTPVLAKAESYDDEFPYVDLTDVANFCESLRTNASSSATSPVLKSYVDGYCTCPQMLSATNATGFNANGSFSGVGTVTQYTRANVVVSTSGGSCTAQTRHAISPLVCEGAVPTLQSPKNAVAPSEVYVERGTPSQTLMTASTACGDFSNNVQRVKTALAEQNQNAVKLNLSLNLGTIEQTGGLELRPVVMKRVDIEGNNRNHQLANCCPNQREQTMNEDNAVFSLCNSPSPMKGCTTNMNAVNKRKEKQGKCSPSGNQVGIAPRPANKPEDILYIDEDVVGDLPMPGTVRRTPTTMSIAPRPPPCHADSMVRSCSVGYLDLVDAQLVPCEVALMMLRKETPKRLVLVNRKKQKKQRSKAHLNHENTGDRGTCSKPPKLKHCGKSRSLDSSDIFPASISANVCQLPSTSEKPSHENTTEPTPVSIPQNCSPSEKSIRPKVTPPTVTKSTHQHKQHSSKPTQKQQVQDIVCNYSNNDSSETDCESSLETNSSRIPLCLKDPSSVVHSSSSAVATGKIGREEANPHLNNNAFKSSSGMMNGFSALDCLTSSSRKKDLEDTRSLPSPSPCASPRLPRSSPSSPAPSKKSGKRNQSTSPIRKHLLNSPLLNRRQRKNKTTESSDDEVVYSGDEVFNGKNYKDLESFQKAQLRQKLKRGKCKGDGPEGSPTPVPANPRRREFVMHNKAPMWNENSQVYQLDFGGRVTQESAKNFQIEFRGKQVMQFGRIDGNAYTLDFQYPFSALQAFAVALANVTQRLK